MAGGWPRPRAEVEYLYRTRYQGFTARHFHEHLVRDHRFVWSRSWTKEFLQSRNLLPKAEHRGALEERRARHELEQAVERAADIAAAEAFWHALAGLSLGQRGWLPRRSSTGVRSAESLLPELAPPAYEPTESAKRACNLPRRRMAEGGDLCSCLIQLSLLRRSVCAGSF